MNRDIRYIESIIRYCDNIEEAIQLFGTDREDLFDNVHYQNDCAFILIQIGEIVKKLSKDLTDKYTRTEWSNIAKLRDRITHRYESIELQILWEIITDDVPSLKKDCESILTDLRML
jgi:uncharacterized protein with HEPN domain